MKCATDYKPSMGFGLLLQGPPKSRKTTTALEFPDVYIADCGNNLAGPLRWIKEHRPDHIKDIHYDTIDIDENGKEREKSEKWPYLVKCVAAAGNDPKIKTIVIDDLIRVCEFLMDFIIKSKPSNREREMTISDWGPFRNMIGTLIMGTRAYGKLFIMTAHDEINKDDLTGSLIITVNMPSKLTANIGGFFSDVWHCESVVVGTGAEAKITYKVRVLPRANIPSLGNSLNLPYAEFEISGEEFIKKYIYKYENQT